MLQWNAEDFTGQINRYTVERSLADSLWRPLNPPPEPTDSFLFVEQPYYPAQSQYRYRLTAFTQTGEQLTAYSDTVRMQIGAYIDLLDLILPDRYQFNELTYEHRRIIYFPWPYQDLDTTVTVVLTFLPSVQLSRWSRDYPIQKTVIHPSGDRQSWMTHLVREFGVERNFEYIDTSGNDFGYRYLGLLRFFHARDGEYFTSKAGLLQSDRAGVVSADTFVIETMYRHPLKGEATFNFVGTPLGGRGVISEMTGGHYDLWHHMRLIKRVNGVESQQQLPTSPRLAPAYPNPFSENTTLEFTLTTAADVRLTIHDMLGREIRVLDEGFRSPGNYSVTLYARNFSAGTYFCRLQAGSESTLRTLVHIH